MRIICCRSLFIFIAGLIIWCSAFPAFGGDTFTPGWQTGDTWKVKAVYRLHRPGSEAWSAPVYWEYRVGEPIMHKGESCLVLDVVPPDSGPALSARFFYRIKDFSLIYADIGKSRRGKTVSRFISYEGGVPIQTEQTLIPFDTPVFPLSFPSDIRFSVKKSVGPDMKMAEIVRQKARHVQGIAEDEELFQGQNFMRVECVKADGSQMFLQYWKDGTPWPVYGQSANMKYWLAEEEE